MASVKWNLDPTHSELGFKVRHLMITNVSGSFGSFSADVETEEEDFTTAKVNFSADVATINTGNEQRDGHLKSADFFDAENHPKLTFEGTKMEKVSGNDYKLHGNLSIRGTVKPATFDVEFGGIGKDPWGNTKAGFSLNGKINRNDWGLTWNAPIEAGGMLVSEDVKIHAEVQFAK
jgi:polyisoprenoid-binding protein YceI